MAEFAIIEEEAAAIVMMLTDDDSHIPDIDKYIDIERYRFCETKSQVKRCTVVSTDPTRVRCDAAIKPVLPRIMDLDKTLNASATPSVLSATTME